MSPKKDDGTAAEPGENKGAMERMAANVAAREAAAAGDDDAPPVDTDADTEPSTPAPNEPPADPQQPRQPNSSKNRWRENNEKREVAERRAAELLAENAALRALQEERRREADAKPAEPVADKHKAELDDIKLKEQRLYRLLHATPNMPADVLADMQEQAEQLNQRRQRIAVSQALEERDKTNPPQQQNVMAEFLRSQFPDVEANKAAMGYSEGYYKMELAKGRPDSWQLRAEALQKGREQFRTAPSPVPRKAPDANAAARLSGTSAGPAGGGGGGGSAPQLSKEEMRMARSRYKHLKDEPKMYAAMAASLSAARAKRAQA